MGVAQSIASLTTAPLKKACQDFWSRIEDALNDGQDPRPSTSKKIEFSLRKPHSSEIYSSSFMSKEE